LENAGITFLNLLSSTHGLAVMPLEVTNICAYSILFNGISLVAAALQTASISTE
jgi:hypothetical protein